jgi:hypothetical protein
MRLYYSNKENRHIDQQEQNTALFLQRSYSRRLFLRQVVTIGVAGLVGPGLLLACSSGNGAERIESEPETADKTSPGAAASGKCEGSSDLSAADIAARQAIKYVDESPQADKICANCRFFKQPAAGAVCGGCEIVKGPIAAEGSCNTWVAQS